MDSYGKARVGTACYSGLVWDGWAWSVTLGRKGEEGNGSLLLVWAGSAGLGTAR